MAYQALEIKPLIPERWSDLDSLFGPSDGRGGLILEGYPVDPLKGRLSDADAYHGLVSTFIKAGFMECARRSETRPIMRMCLTER